jgi:putative membrane protein
MKQPLFLFAAFAGISFLVSCSDSPEKDAKKEADSANTAKIDSAKLRDTSEAHPVHMADLKPDAEFTVAAADGGMLEVALGKIAEKKGTTGAVKKLGAQMVKDHSKANMELKALAKEKHLTIPGEMSPKCQKELSDFDEKKGHDFDKAYADLMVKDHKDDIDDFKKEANSGNDTQISNWAKNILPILEHHLMMSEEVQKNLSK